MIHRLITLLALTVPVLAIAQSYKQNIEAGPIWNQADAERKCPRIAGLSNGKWTGGWRTTVPGRMSVCEIVFGTALTTTARPRTGASVALDTVYNVPARLMGGARQTPDAGGFSGLAGDRAIDLGMGGEAAYVLISDAEFLNVAAANDDQLTLSIWVMNYEIVDSSLFWGVSHSSSSNSRGLSAHVPWSDNSVYFDTAGCCANGSQRLASNIGSFSGYSGYPNWWGSWHHFAFLKKGARKEIWIDGKFFAGGWNARPLPNDFLELWLGSGYRDGRSVHGALDEFAVFGNALSQPDIIKLAAGAAPTELSGNARLFAHWNFDDSGASADGGTVDP